MSIIKTNPRIALASLVLMFALFACTLNIGGPEYPEIRIPISTEAVTSMQESIAQAVANGAISGEVTLTITEEQLTSYLTFKLATQSKPFITDPQVTLRDGQIQIYGTAQSGYFEATVRIVFSPSADAEGKLVIELTEADFGPLPVPAGLKDAITAIISEAYTGALGPIATGFRLESIEIVDGIMSLTGRMK
jgi:hypothetical protein